MENDFTLPTSRLTTSTKTPSLGFKSPEPTTEFTLDQIHKQHDLNSRMIFVIYNRKYNQLLHDPMTGKPVSSRHKHTLEPIIKEFGGTILDLKTAFKRILKHGPIKVDPSTPV